MRTPVKTLTTVAAWLIAVGAVLLGTGFVMLVTQPPHTGANIGAGGAFTFGLGSTGTGLVVGVTAAVSWLRGRRGGQPAVELLSWQKHLKSLTVAAVGLITISAVVLSVATFFFANGHAGSNTFTLFVVGLSIAALALLAGAAPAVYWMSYRRTMARLWRSQAGDPGPG